MQEERGCGCSCNCNCNSFGSSPFLGGVFDRDGGNSILFFIIIFLLLFTDFGCGCRR